VTRAALRAIVARPSRAVKKEVRSDWPGLRAKLAAVRTQIERTDRLIDQVVYRLFGLTEDEIAVVEGSA
jgi:hypothetical protein